jgi:hypothetical protein
MSQLALVELPLLFVTICPYCGKTLGVSEVGEGESWGPAAAWGYIAQKTHEREEGCRNGVQTSLA